MDRLRECREEAGLSQKYVALTLGVKEPSVSNWENGKTRPKHDNLRALAELYGVSTDYLLGLSDRQETAKMPSNLFGVSEQLTHRVPLFGNIAAGQPIYAEGEVRDYVNAPCEADYALTIKGDSMFPDYQDGDIVYILQRDDVPDGAIAVVLIDEEATLKRVYKVQGGASLVSINPKYKPINVENEFGGVRIIGIPCGFTRMFKEG